jgi:TPR repeat protein
MPVLLIILWLSMLGMTPAFAQQPSNPVTAYAQLEQPALLALAEQGDAQAQFVLGERYEQGLGAEQDDRAAEHWFSLAAAQGHAGAQAGLGALYALDLQDVPVDYTAALRWSRQAAQQQDVRGLYNLGVIYRDGLGVLQDNRQAIHWFTLAAEQGDSWAQYNLGQIHGSQNSGDYDPALAMDWYLRAAEQGNPAAYHNLGAMFVEGRGVRSDLVIGYALMAVANLKAVPAQGDGESPADELAKSMEMSGSQVAAGRDLARQLETSPRTRVQAYLSATGNPVETAAGSSLEQVGVKHAL